MTQSMEKIKYPSREFSAAWRKEVGEGRDFCVDAQVSGGNQETIQAYIDAMCKDKKSSGNEKIINMILCIRLIWCIGRVFWTRNYDVDYSENGRWLLIIFRKKPLCI